MKTKGLHHISSIVGHAQRNVDFNTSVLGLRLVKKTLNFDDMSHYHLYYGNRNGSTGLTTTFPWNDAVKGRAGGGQVGTLVYAVGLNTLDFWKSHVESYGIVVEIVNSFGSKRLRFNDPDGLSIELVESTLDVPYMWDSEGMHQEAAIKGIDAVYLESENPDATLKFLTLVLGYEVIDQNDMYSYLRVHDGLGGTLLLNRKTKERGRMGIGVVHHVAFAVDNAEIEAWEVKLKEHGYQPTPVKDRKYFKSVYFREPGGILIELATEGPGVLIDEAEDDLGQTLQIPPHFEAYYRDIEADLMPLHTDHVTKLQNYGYRNRYEYEIVMHRKEILEDITRLRNSEATEGELLELTKLRKEFIKAHQRAKGDN